MKRRDFLKLSQAASLAYMINGSPIRTLASNPVLELLAKQTATSGRVMVLIQLIGGNDGLNMVIPLDRYSELSAARSNILIPSTKVLALNGSTTTGLHPSMTGIRDLYDNGLMNIVQSVGYPDPNFSHFRATDIWMSGSDSNQFINTGWLGRYLDTKYPGFPSGYPNANMPDPLAIEIGSRTSTLFQGADVNMSMSISSIDSFYNIVNGTVDPAPNTPAGHELKFIRYIKQQTEQYNNVIQKAASLAQNKSPLWPASGNRLADQLKIVSRLIAGGLKTPIYIVNLGGFDTHSQQTDATDTTIGNHANLLGWISEAVAAFFDDCKLLDTHERVAAMTFSEFGRRIKANASGGTDHGTTQPLMVFGDGVNPGIIGKSPTLPANASTGDNLPMQHDYRTVYSAILADWFQVDTNTMNQILMKNYQIQPVFKKTIDVADTSEYGSDDILGQNYPNPFTKETTITFGSEGGLTTIQLFDVNGRLVNNVLQKEMSRGKHQITINRNGLPPGQYFYKLTNGRNKSTKRLVIAD
ncbi:MAG: DUF1501 domain-containing protein [Chitinophagales bacterium]|nr:DUF1501 domain-containing protein [Chitinophagaceae bacterium]MCB9065224.1 DUF1501 domain-containing protein [Chitinophagales bacterium]